MAGIDRLKPALPPPLRAQAALTQTEKAAVNQVVAPRDAFALPELHLPHLPNVGTGLGNAAHDVASWLHLPFPGKGSAKDIGWIQDVKPPTTDVTGSFEKLDAAAKAGKDVLPSDAKDFVYLSVGGLFSQAAPTYFDPNMDALAKAGCEVGQVPVNTVDGVRHNAAIVRDTIMKYAQEGKKVVLIGHSMGGLDASAALALYPELKDHVRALVTIQSPYGGSPMAGDLLEVPGLKTIGGAVIKEVFGGQVKCATDLTYASRQKFLEQHPMPAGIPTVCMASSRLSPLSAFFSTAEYMKVRYGLDTDGMVSPKDAFIPGAQTVTLSGLDHGDSTLQPLNPFLPYKPGDLTLGLVALALKAPPLPAQPPYVAPTDRAA
jgi:pimeloyl-ACP methyl ester carboxylesterase